MSMSSLGGLFWSYIYPILASLLYNSIDFLPRSSTWFRWKSSRKTSTLPLSQRDQIPKHILFFCPSLGEYESIASLISSLKANDPTAFIEITFFSDSGFRPLDQSITHLADQISYSPPDTKKLTKEFFSNRKVDQVIISSLALWPTFLDHLHQLNIPYSFVAVRIKNGFLKKIYLSSMSMYLKRADNIFTIETSDQQKLESISVDFNIETLGDPRLNSVISQLKTSKTDLTTEQFLGQQTSKHKKIIFASTHSADELVFMSVISDLIKEGYAIIIAPHHADRAQNVQNTLESLSISSTFHSSFVRGREVLIIDHIGLLKHLYQYCDVAYVGGGFDKGLHNIAEPLFSNCYTLIGPNIKNSYIAQKLESSNTIKIIHNTSELKTAIKNYPIDQPITKKVESSLAEHIGSSERIYNKLFQSK